MSAYPAKPALVAHAFFPARRVLAEPGSAARQAVDGIWAWAEAQGYTDPIGGWKTELVLPGDGEADEQDYLEVLAAASRKTAGGSRQILVYRIFDVVGVSSVDAVHGERNSWDGFDDGWLVQLPAAEGRDLFGSAVVLSGLTADPAGQAAGLAGQVPARQGGAELGPPWRPTGRMLVHDLLVRGEALPRRLFVLAEPDDEPVLDEWLWTSPAAGLPLFTRYLLQAARLRHQRAVLRAALPGLRATVRQIDEGCAALDDLLGAHEVPIDRVVSADRALSELSTRQQGLIEQLSGIQTMIRTVRTITYNLDALVTEGRAGAVDRRIADWTLEQLRSEEAYLQAAKLKSAELSRSAGATITTRIEDRRANLALLQTSVLGAVLMALAAVQSLEYRLPLPGRLQPALIFLLAALALLLPSAVLRWPRSAGRGARLSRIDASFVAVAAAGAGWLVTSLGSWLGDRLDVTGRWPDLLTPVVAFAAGLAGWSAARRRHRENA